MRNDKDAAIALRKDGKSYREICKILKIPKSTLNGWLSGIKWSQEIKKRLSEIALENARVRMKEMARQAGNDRLKLYQQKRIIAGQKFKKFKQEKLFISGLMIYWGEGDSNLKNGAIRVANTDPLMLRLFHVFLKKYLSEISDKAKAYLVLYPDLNDDVCRKFWSEQIGVPLEKFIKSQYIKGRHPTKRLSYGICTIIITSRAYKEMINAWIELIKKDIQLMRV